MLSISSVDATVRESTMSEVPNSGTAHGTDALTLMKSVNRYFEHK